MKKYRLFIADIDNTLVDHAIGKPGIKTLQALQQLKDDGVKVCIASGRPMWQGLENHYKDWGLHEQFDYLVGLNGGEVYIKETNETKLFHPLSSDDVKEIITTMHAIDDINPFIYYEDNVMLAQKYDEEMVASSKRHFSDFKIADHVEQLWSHATGKVLFRCHTPEKAQEALHFAQLSFKDKYTCFLTNPTLLEIQYPDVSKGSGLQYIVESMGITLDEVIAFGDAENDIEMLEIAGKSVALLNAMDDVKKICDDVTEYDVTHDGVGEYLYKNIL